MMDTKQELEGWLEQEAGLTGTRLNVAVDMCEGAGIESVIDMEEMLRTGDLKDMLRARALVMANSIHKQITVTLKKREDVIDNITVLAIPPTNSALGP